MKNKLPAFFVSAAFFLLILIPTPAFLLLPDHLAVSNLFHEKQPIPTPLTTGIPQFSKKFEEWYNVFMPFHHQINQINFSFCTAVGLQPADIVCIGKKGWYFYNQNVLPLKNKILSERIYADYLGTNLFSYMQCQEIIKNLSSLRNECQKRKIPLVILIAPNKATVYGDEYYPDGWKRKNLNVLTRARQITRLLREEGFTVIYPEDELLKWKKELSCDLYYHRDSHWNHIAGYIVARDLIKQIEPIRNIPEINTRKIYMDGMQKSDFVKLIDASEDLYETSPYIRVDDMGYFYGGHPDYRWLPENKKVPDGKRVFFYGDSFMTALQPVVCNNTRQIAICRDYELNSMVLDEFQPDVIVFETVERFLDRMLFFKRGNMTKPPRIIEEKNYLKRKDGSEIH